MYLMPRSTIKRLLAAAQTTPYYHDEAIYLTGFCASKANVTLWSAEKRYLKLKIMSLCTIINSRLFRFFDLKPNDEPDPCYAWEMLSWPTSSMMASHQTIERLYINKTSRCSYDVPYTKQPRQITFHRVID